MNSVGLPGPVGNGKGSPPKYHPIPSPRTLELRPANLITKMMIRINLSGRVTIAFISINFGPIAREREI